MINIFLIVCNVVFVGFIQTLLYLSKKSNQTKIDRDMCRTCRRYSKASKATSYSLEYRVNDVTVLALLPIGTFGIMSRYLCHIVKILCYDKYRHGLNKTN